MKRLITLISAGILILAGCQRSAKTEDIASVTQEDQSVSRKCASHEVLEEQMRNNPSLRQRMEEIESFTQKVIENPDAYRMVGDILEVPVVFNVLYNTASQNVSDAQLASQIAILNDDFSGTNEDVSNTPSIFTGVLSGDVKVRFVHQATVRKQTNVSAWSTNDAMKRSSSGGIDYTPGPVMNVWVCNLGGGILGYAQFPGGAAATDGIVLDDNATGNTGTAAAPFGLGRTATHEVGHYFNLRHIWGDARCGTDLVGDTPQHDASNGGCPPPNHLSKCKNRPVEMTMNYMDYTYDACMYMFTTGQKTRMQATWAVGGPRENLRN